MGRFTEQLDIEERTQIGQLKNHHRSMARDMVVGGLRNHQLAKIYGISEGYICVIVNSPLFICEVARLEAMVEDEVVGAKQRLLALAPQAAKVLAENLYDDDEDIHIRQLKTKSAIDILDRIIPKREPMRIGAVNIQQNIDARKMSTEELREGVFELLADETDDEGNSES